MPCFFTPSFASALSIFLLPLLPATPGWQDTAPQNQPPANTSGTVATPKTVSMEMDGARLRAALDLLFKQSKKEFSLSENIPNTKISLNIVDQPFDSALSLLLREGSTPEWRLTFVKEGSVYRIMAVPNSSPDARIERIPIANVQAETLTQQIQALVPDALVLTDAHTNSLLIRGTGDTIQRAEIAARMLDLSPKKLHIKAEVVMTLEGKEAGSNLRLVTTLDSLSGKEAEAEETISSTPERTSRLMVRAKPLPVASGAYEVTTRWEVSLPILTTIEGPIGPGGAKQIGMRVVKIEKRMTNTTRIKPGKNAAVGTIQLSQYGLKGQVVFFVTVTEADDAD